MPRSLDHAVRRVTTLLWCLVMVSLLGMGSRAFAREPVVAGGEWQMQHAPEPDSPFGLPPVSSDLAEDAEPEKSAEGDDSVVRPDTRAPLELCSGLVAAVRAARLALRSSQAFEQRRHNRGPPA